MPTYEYECPDCGGSFEKFQSITARPVRRCPLCGKRNVRRLIGAGAGLLFRGSGFYQTDYRSEEYKRKAKADAKPAGAASDSGSKAGASPSTDAASKHAKKTGS